MPDWFEFQVVGEHPAGDHVLVLGKEIGGKLLDPKDTPMIDHETGVIRRICARSRRFRRLNGTVLAVSPMPPMPPMPLDLVG